MKEYQLANGVSMPAIGFGTSEVSNEILPDVIQSAADVGYRLFDTAEDYMNEAEVGEGIRWSGLSRSEFFITSKVAFRHHGYDSTLRSFESSLKRLQMDYIDLYMIHWPIYKDRETWKAFERLYREKQVRAIGVCNFLPEHLERLDADIMPMVCQYEITPCLQQKKLRSYFADRNIVSQAYSPMMQGKVFTMEGLKVIAEKHNISIAAVVGSWMLREQVALLTRTTSKAHQIENWNSDETLLDDEDLSVIMALETGERIHGDPQTFGPMMLEYLNQNGIAWEDADNFVKEHGVSYKMGR